MDSDTGHYDSNTNFSSWHSVSHRRAFLLISSILIFSVFLSFLLGAQHGGNIVGNTNSNINSGGSYAVNKNWVYFSTDALYRMRLNGGRTVRVSSNRAAYINIVGDWVYYCSDFAEGGDGHIYKVRLNGRERQQIYDGWVTDLHVIGDWMYFGEGKSDVSTSCLIYRMKTDGRGKQGLSTNFVNSFALSEEYIFYGSNNGIYRLKADGSDETRIFDHKAYVIEVKDGYIYYKRKTDNLWFTDLYRIKTDGTGLTKLSDDMVSNVHIAGESIYFRGTNAKEQGFYKMKLDGTEKVKLFENSENKWFESVIDGRILFMENNKLYMMRADGSGRKMIWAYKE